MCGTPGGRTVRHTRVNAKRISPARNVSLNQLITLTLAEKVATLLAEEYLVTDVNPEKYERLCSGRLFRAAGRWGCRRAGVESDIIWPS